MRVHVDNRNTVDGQPIGKGLFSKAYLVDGTVYIINYKNDPSKECIALFCQGENKHVPSIEYLGYNNQDKQVFKMPFYNKLTTKNKVAWKQGKELRTFLETARQNFDYRKPYTFSEWVLNNLDSLQVTDEVKEAIILILENAKNYGEDCLLEANRGNLGVDENENLILRDILCFTSSIDRARQRKNKF